MCGNLPRIFLLDLLEHLICHEDFMLPPTYRGKVWPISRVGAQGPGRYARSPILQRTHCERCCLIPVSRRGSPTFGHVLCDVWVAIVERCQDSPVEGVGIAMPGDGVNICPRTTDNSLREQRLIFNGGG
jgi:hypothetical protein